MGNWSRGRGATTDAKNKWDDVQTFQKAPVFKNGFVNDGPVNDNAKLISADYTAVAGDHLMVDTSSAAVTVTLPAGPSSMDFVTIEDAYGTFDSYNLIIARNSAKIEGVAADATITTEGATIVMRYIDSTQGWRLKIY